MMFNINMKELEANYKKLQKKLHPDLFGSKSLVTTNYNNIILYIYYVNSFIKYIWFLGRAKDFKF